MRLASREWERGTFRFVDGINSFDVTLGQKVMWERWPSSEEKHAIDCADGETSWRRCEDHLPRSGRDPASMEEVEAVRMRIK